MKATGIVRRIDELGRIVVPKELRRNLRIREGDPVEIYVDPDSTIVIKKYSPIAQLRVVAEDMVESMVGTTDRVALVCDRDTVIAASGPDTAFAVGKTVGRAVEKAMIERQVLLVHYRGGGDASSILAENDEDLPIVSAAIAPIIVEGDPLGAVVMGTTSSEHTVGDLEEKLVTTAAGYMARQVN